VCIRYGSLLASHLKAGEAGFVTWHRPFLKLDQEDRRCDSHHVELVLHLWSPRIILATCTQTEGLPIDSDCQDCAATVLQICYHRQTGKPLGYAVAHFTNALAAQHAIDTLNDVEVDGRHIVVAPYRSRVSDPTQAKAAAPSRAPAVSTGTQAHGLVLNLHKDATWMYVSDAPQMLYN
jgi:hypothetical protein